MTNQNTQETKNIVTIDTTEGAVKIDQKLVQKYIEEAFEHLQSKHYAEELFKEVVETLSETTGMKKTKVSKYLKQRFDETTKETKELGELFTALDEALV